RVLIIAGLAFLLYRILKRAFGTQEKIDRKRSDGVIDEMVQDRHCKTYIPRREAVRRVIAGQEYFFCGKACADEFEKGKKRKGADRG
ncbi:MAG: hypothetical protein GY864_10325, partial [Desulfobacterales bacterium]|nr:hypothetical protein [Desulfobacterales bacterium]